MTQTSLGFSMVAKIRAAKVILAMVLPTSMMLTPVEGGEERKKKGLSIDAGEGVNTAGWLGGQGLCEVHEGVVILAFVQGIIVSPE